MKAATMLLTPKFDVESSRRILAEASRPLSAERRAKLQLLASVAKKAYNK